MKLAKVSVFILAFAIGLATVFASNFISHKVLDLWRGSSVSSDASHLSKGISKEVTILSSKRMSNLQRLVQDMNVGEVGYVSLDAIVAKRDYGYGYAIERHFIISPVETAYDNVYVERTPTGLIFRMPAAANTYEESFADRLEVVNSVDYAYHYWPIEPLL